MQAETVEQFSLLQLERTLVRFKIPWAVFAIIAAVMVFLLSSKPSLELGSDKLLEYAVHDAIITGYVLLMWPLSKFLLTKSFRSLTSLTAEDPALSLPPSSAREWQLPLVFGLVMAFIDNSDTENFLSLSPWLFIISGVITYGAIAWVVYAVFVSARQVNHYVSKVTQVQVFDVSPFRPVANWSLSISAMIMIGLSISLLFLRGDFLDVQNLVVYILTSIMGVVVFFAGMWSTHALMAYRKEQELARINAELDSLHHETLEKIKNRELESSQALLQTGEALTNHKIRLEKLPEWPYTFEDLGGLVTSMLLPYLLDIIFKLF